MDRLELNDDQRKRLRIFEALLKKWSKIKNLVAASTLDQVWERHILDSVQVQKCVPDARIWLDIGSGAGFPGLVTAILLAEHPNSLVHLVESDNRKCAFLRDVSRETGIKTLVHPRRIEAVLPTLSGVDAVSARALAPLPQLVDWCHGLLLSGTIGVFPKGREASSELTRLAQDSKFSFTLKPSLTHADGTIVIVRNRDSGDSGALRDECRDESSGSG